MLISPKFDPNLVYSILCFVAGSTSSSNFPNCFSCKDLTLVYANYLRSHFSVCQPKALHSRARGYLSELSCVLCPEKSYSSLYSFLISTEFLVAAGNLFPITAPGSDRKGYPMPKHFSCSGMNLLHVVIFPGICIPFLASVIPIYKMRMPVNSHAFFLSLSLKSCVSKLFEHIILSCLLFLLECNSILLFSFPT